MGVVVGRKLSWQMQRVLLQLLRKQPADAHCRTQADYGGLTATLTALRRRGLIGDNHRLTRKGRVEAAWVGIRRDN